MQQQTLSGENCRTLFLSESLYFLLENIYKYSTEKISNSPGFPLESLTNISGDQRNHQRVNQNYSMGQQNHRKVKQSNSEGQHSHQQILSKFTFMYVYKLSIKNQFQLDSSMVLLTINVLLDSPMVLLIPREKFCWTLRWKL